VRSSRDSICIRDARLTDAAAMLEIYAPSVVGSAVSFELELPSIEQFKSRIEKYQKHHPWLVATQKQNILGYAYANPYRSRGAYKYSCEVSAYTAAESRGQGIGRALYLELFVRLQAQGTRNAYAIITLPNPGSVAFHQALGFDALAVFPQAGFKLDAWHDVGWWGIRLPG
jgi:L-amino acid N-acyltransferase YncA